MSPLTEKLAAILDDWDQLTSVLNDLQQQCVSKDGAIVGLQQTIATQQQQLNKQAGELANLKNQLAQMQAQATAALLTAADPDDARIKQRIESAFASVAAKPMVVPLSPSANVSQAPVRPATPTVFSESNGGGQGVPKSAVNGNGRLVIPGRTGNGAGKPPPQPQPTSPLSIGRVSQGAGAGAGSVAGTSRYNSSEEAS
ncbi:MAG: hypothetical protein ABSF29_14610 [Tepidisphaeraceae bacterium]|jgi:uncharacterized coiled-coil protein SlyX